MKNRANASFFSVEKINVSLPLQSVPPIMGANLNTNTTPSLTLNATLNATLSLRKFQHYVTSTTAPFPASLWIGVAVGCCLALACCVCMCRSCRGVGPSNRPNDNVEYEGLPLITIKNAGRR